MASILSQPQWVGSSGAETRIVQDNYCSTMAVDALAPCGARPSAAIVVNLQDISGIALWNEGFQ